VSTATSVVIPLPLRTEQHFSERYVSSNIRKDPSTLTLASAVTGGLLGNSTSVAFNIVFSSKMAACDKLCPNGCHNIHTDKLNMAPTLSASPHWPSGQGRCVPNLHTWCLVSSYKCVCGMVETMSRTVSKIHDGGLQRLHSTRYS